MREVDIDELGIPEWRCSICDCFTVNKSVAVNDYRRCGRCDDEICVDCSRLDKKGNLYLCLDCLEDDHE